MPGWMKWALTARTSRCAVSKGMLQRGRSGAVNEPRSSSSTSRCRASIPSGVARSGTHPPTRDAAGQCSSVAILSDAETLCSSVAFLRAAAPSRVEDWRSHSRTPVGGRSSPQISPAAPSLGFTTRSQPLRGATASNCGKVRSPEPFVALSLPVAPWSVSSTGPPGRRIVERVT
jgi:hypothetical protein